MRDIDFEMHVHEIIRACSFKKSDETTFDHIFRSYEFFLFYRLNKFVYFDIL